MEQLLVHLFSDYWLQNDWMALNKKKHFWIALTHSIIYTIPFLLLIHSIMALMAICLTHAIIDGTRIVEIFNRIKNWKFDEEECCVFMPDNYIGRSFKQFNFKLRDGYNHRPFAIRVWLIIIQDNILHLIINYLAIKYL